MTRTAHNPPRLPLAKASGGKLITGVPAAGSDFDSFRRIYQCCNSILANCGPVICCDVHSPQELWMRNGYAASNIARYRIPNPFYSLDMAGAQNIDVIMRGKRIATSGTWRVRYRVDGGAWSAYSEVNGGTVETDFVWLYASVDTFLSGSPYVDVDFEIDATDTTAATNCIYCVEFRWVQQGTAIPAGLLTTDTNYFTGLDDEIMSAANEPGSIAWLQMAASMLDYLYKFQIPVLVLGAVGNVASSITRLRNITDTLTTLFVGRANLEIVDDNYDFLVIHIYVSADDLTGYTGTIEITVGATVQTDTTLSVGWNSWQADYAEGDLITIKYKACEIDSYSIWRGHPEF